MAAQLSAPFPAVSSQRARLPRTLTLGRGFLWLVLLTASGLPLPGGNLRCGVYQSPPGALGLEYEDKGIFAVQWTDSSRKNGAIPDKRLHLNIIMREAPV